MSDNSYYIIKARGGLRRADEWRYVQDGTDVYTNDWTKAKRFYSLDEAWREAYSHETIERIDR